MYGVMGVSTPSLHRESTNSLIYMCYYYICYFTGAIALQTTTFPITQEIYTDDGVQAVVSVNCIGNETVFDECSWIVTNIAIDNTCSIDHVAEVVCQGT